jgi:LDH2 family malate/lactate/ureidoglycolate dehydrogenase
MKFIDPNKTYNFLNNILYNKGVLPDIAHTVSDSLIQTSIRGVDSHGINLFPHYYNEIDLGRLNTSPNLVIDQRASSAAILDAQNTLGHYAGKLAMNHAIDVAKQTGIGVVSVKNSTHFGAAWYFTNMAANQGLLGFAFTNTEALANAFNSKDVFFGTNPFCFSAPIKDEEPFCLDMATTTIPWNKVKNYRRQNQQLQIDWAFDQHGVITTDPHKAVSLTNIGGYKGFGLSMVIEILCSGLAAGPISSEIAPLYDLNIKHDRKISHFFMVLDISKFISIDWFQHYMMNMATQIRNLPKAGDENVMIAGDKEKQAYVTRHEYGIPIDDQKFNEFLQISQDFYNVII